MSPVVTVDRPLDPWVSFSSSLKRGAGTRCTLRYLNAENSGFMKKIT